MKSKGTALKKTPSWYGARKALYFCSETKNIQSLVLLWNAYQSVWNYWYDKSGCTYIWKKIGWYVVFYDRMKWNKLMLCRSVCCITCSERSSHRRTWLSRSFQSVWVYVMSLNNILPSLHFSLAVIVFKNLQSYKIDVL